MLVREVQFFNLQFSLLVEIAWVERKEKKVNAIYQKLIGHNKFICEANTLIPWNDQQLSSWLFVWLVLCQRKMNFG